MGNKIITSKNVSLSENCRHLSGASCYTAAEPPDYFVIKKRDVKTTSSRNWMLSKEDMYLEKI